MIGLFLEDEEAMGLLQYTKRNSGKLMMNFKSLKFEYFMVYKDKDNVDYPFYPKLA